jgi:hypothetical protein
MSLGQGVAFVLPQRLCFSKARSATVVAILLIEGGAPHGSNRPF